MDATIKAGIAELIGTFVLVFFGVGAAIFSGSVIVTALAFGLTVMVMSVTIGRISGCHLNTAISIAMFMDKQIDAKKLVTYIVCQIIGAIIAGGLLYALYTGMDYTWVDQGCNVIPNDTVWVALLTEIVLTFIFVLVVFGATDKSHQGVFSEFGGFFIGLALAMVHLVGINITGTSVNPARSIGLAIFSENCLGDVWVFIVAPIIGAILAWAVYKYVLRDETA